MKDPERAIVKVSACGIYAKPTFKSEMVNQALTWEEVLISERKDNWYRIELENDGYKGWIHEMYLTHAQGAFKIIKSCHWVYVNEPAKNNKAYKYPSYQEGSRNVIPISLCQKIPCLNYMNYKKDNSLGAVVKLFFNNELITAQLSCSVTGISRILANRKIAGFAEDFIGYPYLWGGRSHQGYDCSGFIQTVFKLTNYCMPRDAKDQIEVNFLEECEIEDAYPGCLFFFKTNNTVNHVAMASQSFALNHEDGVEYNSDKIIHASGSVCTVSLEKSGLKDKLYKVMKLKDNA